MPQAPEPSSEPEPDGTAGPTDACLGFDIEQLYLDQHKALRGMLRGRGVPHDEIEDVIQDSVAALSVRVRDGGPPENAVAYLHRVAINRAARLRRRDDRRRVLEQRAHAADRHELSDASCDVDDRADRGVAPGRLLSELSAREIEAVRLRYEAGLSVSEAAEVLGVAESTVQTYIRRARTKLAPYFRKEDAQ